MKENTTPMMPGARGNSVNRMPVDSELAKDAVGFSMLMETVSQQQIPDLMRIGKSVEQPVPDGMMEDHNDIH